MQDLKKLLAARRKQGTAETTRTPAAVLIPLYQKQGLCYILFTKRTENVKTHKGQISFPGGVYEPGDGTLVNTALRESEEEIGLRAEDVEIIGELDNTPSVVTNYLITPFVGLIPCPYQFRINPSEVACIIEIPVAALLERKAVIIENRGGGKRNSFQYQQHVIWGATARILEQLLPIIAEVCPGN